MVMERGDLHLVVLGCNKCAKTCNTGGAEQVREVRNRIRQGGTMILEADGLADAIDEGLCDTEAVETSLAPLKKHQGLYQILVLGCGAGLKCLRDLLPNVRLVPGLDTLGPGVGDQLACISCGDCRFGTEGCAMTSIMRVQSDGLERSYNN